MILNYENLDFDLDVRLVNDKVIYSLKVNDFLDDDLETNGGFTIHNCMVPLLYEGYGLSVAVDLTLRNEEHGVISVELVVVDDIVMLKELRELKVQL